MCKAEKSKVNLVSFELSPEWDNIAKSYIDNPKARIKSVNDLIQLVCGTDYHTSIAIDGTWGSGKTFFVKQAKMLMDINNTFVKVDYIDENTKKQIIDKTNNSVRTLIEEKLPVCVYYDAWSNDDTDDPLLSLVYSIVDEYSINFKNYPELENVLKELLDILKPFLPIKLYTILKLPFLFIGKDNYLEAVKNKLVLKDKITSLFNKILLERGNRLIVFIDELDRCSPIFAIKLLERIKHYFNNDNITFVFSVNIKQLACTIRKFYGADFNAVKYIERFFDFVITMPEFDMDYFCESLMFDDPFEDSKSMLTTITKSLDLNLRETARFMRSINCFKNYYVKTCLNAHYPDDFKNTIVFAYKLLILPILGLLSKDMTYKDKLLSGDGYQMYSNLTNTIKEYKILCEHLSSFVGARPDEDMSKRVYASYSEEYSKSNNIKPISNFISIKDVLERAFDFPRELSTCFEKINNDE